MPNFSINHVAISVKDVDISINFYQSVFSLKEIKNTASTSKTRWLVFDDRRQLHLIPRPEEEIKVNKAVHLALSTANVPSFVNHLEQLKIPYSDWKNTPSKNYIRKDGILQFYFQDPDGYWIEVNNDVR